MTSQPRKPYDKLGNPAAFAGESKGVKPRERKSMLVKSDVAVILEALAYYSKHVVGQRDRARVWKVYFGVREYFGVDDVPRKRRRKIKILLTIIVGTAGILTGYVISR